MLANDRGIPLRRAGSATAAVAAERFRWRGAAPIGLILPAAVLVLWEVAARLALLPANLLPPPSAITATLLQLAERGELAEHVLTTSGRVAAGFLAGALAATLLGAACGAIPLLHRLLDPTVQALKSVPSLAWVPLFILWFGIFETSKIVLIAVGVFFPVYLALAAGIPNVDRKLVEVARVYRFSTVRLIRRVLLPAVLPTYFIGLRAGLGLGWMFVVAAELMGASAGLGYLLIDGQQTGKPALIIASIVLFAVLGKATDLLLAVAAQRALRWQDAFKSSDKRV